MMKLLRGNPGARATVLVAAALFSTLGVVGAAQAEPGVEAAAGTCSHKSDAYTAKTATVDTIRIELRYSPSIRCSWGRITNADPGDQVWVDRSYDNGKTWEGPLNVTTVRTGSDTYTASRYNGGNLMRACGKNDSTGHVKCTGWW
ncbi:DUF2690 domain-containing protein [Streptomyces sp. G35A]